MSAPINQAAAAQLYRRDQNGEPQSPRNRKAKANNCILSKKKKHTTTFFLSSAARSALLRGLALPGALPDPRSPGHQGRNPWWKQGEKGQQNLEGNLERKEKKKSAPPGRGWRALHCSAGGGGEREGEGLPAAQKIPKLNPKLKPKLKGERLFPTSCKARGKEICCKQQRGGTSGRDQAWGSTPQNKTTTAKSQRLPPPPQHHPLPQHKTTL